MTYNIRNGGRPDRLPALAAVIAQARPDILALQELRGFTSARLAGLAADLGMRAHLAGSLFGQPVGILVGPALPVVHSGRLRRPFHHGIPFVTVGTGLGPVTVVAAHLHPLSGGRRLREARWLADFARRREPALLLGDLNSLDPWTDHTDRLSRLATACLL
jgi:exodeoxyribonuclease-3